MRMMAKSKQKIETRVETLAKAGGICISGRIYDMIENKLELE